MEARVVENLGHPSLRIAGFQLWIHEEPGAFSSGEPYEGWLSVTAHCGASGASVWTQGSILELSDIVAFGDQCSALARGERTTAALDPIEPWMNVTLEKLDRLGHVGLRVEITPELGEQSHSFKFEIDQTYLAGIVRDCAAIVADLRGTRPDANAR